MTVIRDRDFPDILWREVYSAKEGGMERASDIDSDDPRRIPGWCGACKSTPCLVESGEVCCHNHVRYGTCEHTL